MRLVSILHDILLSDAKCAEKKEELQRLFILHVIIIKAAPPPPSSNPPIHICVYIIWERKSFNL